MSDESPPPSLPAVPTFAPEEKVCGNCKLWSAHSVEARGWVGPCRLQPQRGLFVPSAPICDAFVPRGSVNGTRPVERESSRPRPVRSVAPVVVRQGQPVSGAVTQAVPPAVSPAAAMIGPASRLSQHSDEPRRVPGSGAGDTIDFGGGLTLTRDELIDLFREAAGDPNPPPMANKWAGGFVQLVPGNKELQGKELPIDSLFHKVVMIRDRLRTLEQKVNGHPKLSDADKVEMQQYITRAYGSLTSFNILFRDKNDFFVGQKGDE